MIELFPQHLKNILNKNIQRKWVHNLYWLSKPWQIPADMVINAALVAMAVHWNGKLQVIYHVSSSCQNPLSVNDFVDSCFDYFSISPRILNGRVLQTRRPYLFKRYAFFRVCLMIIFSLPLMVRRYKIIFCIWWIIHIFGHLVIPFLADFGRIQFVIMWVFFPILQWPQPEIQFLHTPCEVVCTISIL